MNLASPSLESRDSALLSVQRLGLIEYQVALDQQRLIHSEVVGRTRENTLLLLEHPSVYTAGKRTSLEERPTNGLPVIDVDRGGKITWHGPGQIVGYPIIKLAKPTELVGFVRELESALIKVCAEFGIAASRVDGRSGVWVATNGAPRKIAAIGIRVASGVSMHGVALNVHPDLAAFSQIIPCGINDAEVTSLALELGRPITSSEVLPIVEKYLTQSLVKVGV
jgi:lipoyl(octanoyl) transferase|uniref:lipoyl(octanoyl) transferase LipB n=1 Tax=Candidatus Planktophila sp. TaxID=2175601 RepID=UPI004049A5B8